MAVGAVFCTVFIISFALFQIPVKAAAYPALICAVGGTVYILVDFRRVKKKHRQLQDMQRLSASTIEYFPEADRVEEEDYQQLIRLLCREYKQTETELSARIFDMEEYYAVWAHQIKTPIASMRLQRKGDKRSSGIGLYFCRRVCDNLSHSIRAESKPGQGTSIYIRYRPREGTAGDGVTSYKNVSFGGGNVSLIYGGPFPFF